MRTKTRTVEQRIASIASRQRGVITVEQMLGSGIDRSGIKRRVKKGLLIPEYRGVYRVGHSAPSTEAKYTAAVLAAGKGAVLAGQAAGHLMRLLKGSAPPPEVVAPTEKHIEGLATKQCRNLSRRDIWTYNGIPCTTIARTLVDLAAVLSEDDLALAFHEASVLYRTQPKDVEAVLDRRPNVKGAAKLRRVLRGDARVTLSRLEKRFLKLLEENKLELPETNKRIGGRYVDCRWPEHKLTVELDSYRYHATRHAWEQDHKRERQARAREDDFRRYTSEDVFDDPRALLRELRPIIGFSRK